MVVISISMCASCVFGMRIICCTIEPPFCMHHTYLCNLRCTFLCGKGNFKGKTSMFLKMIVTDNMFFFFLCRRGITWVSVVTNCLTDCTFYSWVMSARTITVLKFHQVLLIFGVPFEQSRLHSASEISSMENTATHKKLALLFTLTVFIFQGQFQSTFTAMTVKLNHRLNECNLSDK